MSSVSAPIISPLQPHHIRNLLLILHRANTHYQSVAAHIRATLQPTHHARMQAQRLGLKVDIHKATRCEQKQISVVPLPILDTTVSPVTLAAPSISSNGNPSPTLETLRAQARELSVLDGKPPLRRRPALKCTIPGRLTRTTPNGTTSAITLSSSTSHYSSVSLSSPVAASDVLGIKLISARPISDWYEDEEDMLSVYPDIFMESAVTTPDVPATQDWQPLDVPIDEGDIDWGFDNLSDMDVSPLSSPGSLESGSDGTSSSYRSSAGLLTPTDEGPITIRIKRKSIEVSNHDMSNFEKRPRLSHKGLNTHIPVPHRKNVIRIPVRK